MRAALVLQVDEELTRQRLDVVKVPNRVRDALELVIRDV